MIRRDFLKNLTILPVAAPLVADIAIKANTPGSLHMQPLPVKFQFARLEGVTSIVRHWTDGDERRCRLCSECTALRGVCLVVTTEDVSEEDMPVYSTVGLDMIG